MMKIRHLATVALLTTMGLAAPANAENLEHTRQLLSTNQCQECELSGVGLTLANLSQVDLSRADLSRANLSRSDLSRANLSGANLASASLFGANLSGANLRGADLRGADLRGAYLVDADLVGADLSGTDLQGVVGLPTYVGVAKTEEFYSWGVAAAQQQNYTAAIENFNQALSSNPNFAPAYLARGVARFPIGDVVGAKQDAQVAATLFSVQRNPSGYQAAQNLVKTVEAYQEAYKRQNNPKGGGLGGVLGSLGPLLLKFLIP